MWEKTFSSRGLAPALGLCLAVAGSPALGAEHTFDGVYSGKRVLTKGSASSICPAEGDVSVTVNGETLTFTDRELQKTTQPFYPDPDGSFGQTFTGRGGDVVHYHGRIVGDVMDADVANYAIAPCEYHWHLKKANLRE
jgi:hypothetical protein